MSIWVTGTVMDVKYWTDKLFTIIIRAPIDPFIAGQFTKMAIKINDVIVQRAYSYLNAPNDLNLEFYITTVLNGKFTSFLSSLCPGSTLMLTKKAYGQFTLQAVPENCKNLWMLATGTGIGPYLSILEYHDRRLDDFENIVLIHATRFYKNLNYLLKILNFKKIYRNKLHVCTVLSQEESEHSLYGRVPDLLEHDVLEDKIGLSLDAKNSHVMLCGNPGMISDTKIILKKKIWYDRLREI